MARLPTGPRSAGEARGTKDGPRPKDPFAGVGYPVTVRCGFCRHDLTIALAPGKAGKVGTTTTTTGHAPSCVMLPKAKRT